MANLKNFGIQGVGSDVQFGKGGTRLIAADGAFQFRNAANSALVTAQAATPSANNDVVIKSYADDASSATRTGAGLVTANGAYLANTSTFYIASATSLKNADDRLDAAINALQLELDDTQAAAGLDTDGSFIAFGGSTYLGNATSLANAISLLDSAVAAGTGGLGAEVDRIEAAVGLDATGNFVTITGTYTGAANTIVEAIQALDLQANAVQLELNATQAGAGLTAAGAYVANTTGSYLDAAVSLFDADMLLDAAIAGVQGELDATQTGAGLLANGVYVAASANYITTATSLFNADVLLDAALKAEEVARIDADSDLQGELDTTQTGAGLGTDGTYTANANTTYLGSASSLKNADELLDVALAGVQTEVNNIETSMGSAMAANGTFTGFTGTAYINNATSFSNALTLIDTTVSDVWASVEALGNAFNYVGTVAGGVDAGNAVVVSATETDAGDYFKVGTAGYFKADANATPIFANVGDGLVYNLSAGIDKIDNTDSTVAGTGGRIAVTGSADTGFTVDIDNSYVGQTSITTLGTVTTGTWNGSVVAEVYGGTGESTYSVGDLLVGDGSNGLTKKARGSAEQFLRVNSAGSDLEYADLVASDVAFSAPGFTATDVANAIIEADSAANAVQIEVDTIETAVGLNANGTFISFSGTTFVNNATSIANAISMLDAGVDAVLDGLQGELDATQTGAGLLANGVYVAASANYITTATSLFNADVLLDAALKDVSNELNTTQTGAGLGTDGTYTANGTANYLSGATSLFNADQILDNAIKTVADDLANLSQDQITSLNTLYSVLASNTAIVFNGNVAGNSVTFGTMITGANTDTEFLVDMTTAGEIAFSAANSDATDVDIRLAPKGTGQVIIGQSATNGVIQADNGGYDLLLVGGDNTGGLGGDVILKGGDGSTGDGSVVIQDGAGNNVLVASAGSAGGYATLSSDANAVTFAATGSSSNLDIVLDAKGTGVINASSTRIVNVSTPTNGTDAANKAYVDDQITSRQVGLVRTAVATVTETNGAATLATAVTGTVLRAKIIVTSAFASGNLLIGRTGDTSAIAGTADFDETATGTYLVEVATDLTAQDILATVPGSSGTGSARVIVEYLVG